MVMTVFNQYYSIFNDIQLFNCGIQFNDPMTIV